MIRDDDVLRDDQPNRYFDPHFKVETAKILPGEYYATNMDMALVTVLGSCVSACLRDRDNGIGGMNHFMLPDEGKLIGTHGNISAGGRHIHHMTFGIIGLLTVGYLWMLEFGVAPTQRRSSRLTSGAYGAGAALTLDEFAAKA